jgi:hypothetical protein
MRDKHSVSGQLIKAVREGEITLDDLRAERDAIHERRDFTEEEEERFEALNRAILFSPDENKHS